MSAVNCNVLDRINLLLPNILSEASSSGLDLLCSIQSPSKLSSFIGKQSRLSHPTYSVVGKVKHVRENFLAALAASCSLRLWHPKVLTQFFILTGTRSMLKSTRMKERVGNWVSGSRRLLVEQRSLKFSLGHVSSPDVYLGVTSNRIG